MSADLERERSDLGEDRQVEYEIEEDEDDGLSEASDEDDENFEASVYGGEMHKDHDGQTGDILRHNEEATVWSIFNPPPIVQGLLELIFELAINLSTETVPDNDGDSSLLIYFSGIIGFSHNRGSFLSASRYTPYLSMFIYMIRLLLLECALPLRPYPSLGLAHGPGAHQLQRLNDVRLK